MPPKKVSAPDLSPQEQLLQREQLRMLQQQRQLMNEQIQQQRIMLPFLAEQAGFKLDIDPKTGRVRGITKINDPMADQRKRIEGLQLERSERALRGDLPVDPVLERELGSQEETLRERLRSQYGAGYETSTAGIQTLDEFFRSAEGLRSSARRDEMTLAEQLSMARQGMGMESRGANLGILQGASMGNPMAIFQALGQGAGGIGNALQGYFQNRSLSANIDMFNAQNFAQTMAGWGKLAGTAAGMFMGGGFPGGGGGFPFVAGLR